MYHFPEEVDWTHFFRFDKKLVKNMNWSRISPAAKAIFPVIGCHCNEHGQSFPGEETIAALSGLTDKSVRKGISDLNGFPGFKWEYYKTRQGKRGKKFDIKLPSQSERGRTFFLHRGIMEGGNWCKLKPTAQALYPVMRCFSQYEEHENKDFDENNPQFEYNYNNRKYELCREDISLMADYAGMDRRSRKAALKSLQDNFLIEPYTDKNGEEIWKVYLYPPKSWKASYLNQI